MANRPSDAVGVLPSLTPCPLDSPFNDSDQHGDLDEKRSLSSSGDEKEQRTTTAAGICEKSNPFEGEYNPGEVGHPARVKFVAVFAVLFFSLGSNFLASSISPLKSTLKKELGINNAKYANLDTADSLINTIFPIVSGILIDFYGPMAGALWSSVVIFIGAVLTSIAASRDSYGLFLAGQIIFGFGSATLETSQNKAYSWFCLGGGIVGFVYGLDIGIGRVWNLMGKLTAVPIYEGLNSMAWTFWIGTIMCGFSLFIVAALYLYSLTFPKSSQVPTGRMAALRRAEEAKQRGEIVMTDFFSQWKQERRYFVQSLFLIPACFWILDITQLLQSGAVGTYTSNLADTISVTRKATKEAAGYTSAIGQVIPIILTPALGHVFDRWGNRMHWVTWTASLWIVVFCLLAYTEVHALVPSILGSLALATNVLPWIASIPLLVPNQANLGTAFGIYKALNNCGSVIMGVASGAIQDRTTPGKNEYANVFAFIIIIKGLDVLYGLGYWLFDIKYLGGVLRANDKELRRQEAEIPEEERLSGLRSPIRIVTLLGLGTVAAAIVTAWALYWVYSV
ncbi:hypothetical protein JCM8547_005584 [Rhodosporidiobolus lusitaniae]